MSKRTHTLWMEWYKGSLKECIFRIWVWGSNLFSYNERLNFKRYFYIQKRKAIICFLCLVDTFLSLLSQHWDFFILKCAYWWVYREYKTWNELCRLNQAAIIAYYKTLTHLLTPLAPSAPPTSSSFFVFCTAKYYILFLILFGGNFIGRNMK